MLIEETSTLTAKNQTTVPKAVRKTLGLGPGDQIAYRVSADGSVSLVRRDNDDAAIDTFLAFLSRDIKHNPATIQPMDADAVARMTALTAGPDVDLDASFESTDRG